MLVWPRHEAVLAAARTWAEDAAARHPHVRRIGYFGSYATGRAGVGSDLDLVVIVEASDIPFERRASAWDVTTLPVPADLLVYTAAEWDQLTSATAARVPRLARDVRWLFARPGV